MKLFGMIIPLSLILIRYAARFIFGKPLEMYLDYQWTKFKMDYSKSYDFVEKELYHYDIFLDTLKEIEEHNKKYEAGMMSWKEGINHFSDLSEQDFQESSLVDPKYLEPRFKRIKTHVRNGNAPNSIDWRKLRAVTPVRDQERCNSSWALAATAAVESHYAIKNNRLTQFSPQMLLDCDTAKMNKGCKGGEARYAFDYMTKNGLATERSYPFQAQQGACRNPKPTAKVSGFTWVRPGEKSLMDAVGTVGPVTVALRSTPMKSYQKGIFRCFEGMGDITHEALIVGYGEEDGVPYWLVKNSWSYYWGEKGYIRIKRVHRFMSDCGVYLKAYYPNVEIDEKKKKKNEED